MDFEYNQFTLNNGLRVIHVPRMDAQSVFVSLTGKVGRRAEADSEIGAAHFLEHLFFDGTHKRPSAIDLSRFLEYHGVHYNGSTNQELVEYWVKVIPSKVEIACDFLSDIVSNSLLKTEDIEKERKVIGQEASMKRDNPHEILGRVRLQTLFPGQALGRTIYDEEVNLTHIDHGSLVNYRDRNYHAANFVLSVAGDIGDLEVKNLAEQYFGNWTSGKTSVTFTPSELASQQVINIIHKDLTQSKLSIAFRSYPIFSIREGICASMLALILANGFSSRLYGRLRHEQNIVYTVHARNTFYSDSGFFSIETFMNEDNLQKAIDIIFEEIQKLLGTGISDEELEKARNNERGDLLFAMERPSALAGYLSSSLLLIGNAVSIKELLTMIDDIQVADLHAVARHIFTDQAKINILTKSLNTVTLQ